MKKLHTSTIIWLAIMTILLALFSLSLWSVRTTDKLMTGNCGNLKRAYPETKWSDDCTYIKELVYDPTLKTPQKEMYLSRFIEASALGPPLGANVWYRYRFVRDDTGGYSDFSPWTKSPIIAGSTMLPCKGGDCSNINKHGADSCHSNLIQLGIDELEYTMLNGIYANVHRAYKITSDASPPSDTIKDEIVGYLVPHGPKSYQFIDISESPCDKILCFRPGCQT